MGSGRWKRMEGRQRGRHWWCTSGKKRCWTFEFRINGILKKIVDVDHHVSQRIPNWYSALRPNKTFVYWTDPLYLQMPNMDPRQVIHIWTTIPANRITDRDDFLTGLSWNLHALFVGVLRVVHIRHWVTELPFPVICIWKGQQYEVLLIMAWPRLHFSPDRNHMGRALAERVSGKGFLWWRNSASDKDWCVF